MNSNALMVTATGVASSRLIESADSRTLMALIGPARAPARAPLFTSTSPQAGATSGTAGRSAAPAGSVATRSATATSAEAAMVWANVQIA